MKRSLLCACVLLLGIATGCSSKTQLENVDKGVEEDIEKLPYDNIQYNGETLKLESVDVYKEKSSSGFGYYPYVVVTLDKTGLSEECFYWLIEEKDIDVTCYYTSEKNEVDFSRMPLLKSYYNDTQLVYMFNDYNNEYKHDFSDIELTLSLDLTQEEKYKYENDEGEITDLNKVNAYTCRINSGLSEIESEVKDISELNEEQESMRQQGMQEVIERYDLLFDN